MMAVLALCDSARRARTMQVGATETQVFRRFNQGPDALHLPVWVVMQSGSLAAAFVAGGALARVGRTRTGCAAALAGTVTWVAVKLIKTRIGRGRPADVLEGANVRGHAQTGLGYPSGHAAVAATLASITMPAPAAVQQVAAVAFGGVIGGTRMYVGAHLPLDVVGGVAIGVLCGRAAGALMGRVP